jgi:hypothetical protein
MARGPRRRRGVGNRLESPNERRWGDPREEREEWEWEWEASGARDPMFEQSPGEWVRARVCALTCRARA